MIKSTRQWMRHLGPGLITGASDDDPSGIATYAQTGASLGFGLLWTVLLTLPRDDVLGHSGGFGEASRRMHRFERTPAASMIARSTRPASTSPPMPASDGTLRLRRIQNGNV